MKGDLLLEAFIIKVDQHIAINKRFKSLSVNELETVVTNARILQQKVKSCIEDYLNPNISPAYFNYNLRNTR